MSKWFKAVAFDWENIIKNEQDGDGSVKCVPQTRTSKRCIGKDRTENSQKDPRNKNDSTHKFNFLK